VVSFFLAIGVLLLFECLDIIHSSEVPMALPLLYEIANSIVFHLVIDKNPWVSYDDALLINYLYKTYIIDEDVTVNEMLYNNVIVSTERLFNMLNKYNQLCIYTGSDKNILKYLISRKNFIGFNDLLGSNIFMSKLDSRLAEFLVCVYRNDKMSLRNQLAHCSYGSINYYHYSVVYLLLGIFLSITGGDAH